MGVDYQGARNITRVTAGGRSRHVSVFFRRAVVPSRFVNLNALDYSISPVEQDWICDFSS